MPFPADQTILNPVLGDNSTSRVTQKFQDNTGVIKSANNLNKSISISTGNQYKIGNTKLSFILAGNYKSGSRFYENAEFNTYIYDEQNYPGQFKLINDREITGSVGEESVLMSAMAGFGIKRKNNKVSFQAVRLQNGISKAAQQFDAKSQSGSALLTREIIEYQQREVTNLNITGKHLLNGNKFNITWKLSPTIIKVDEPDIRFSAFEVLGEDSYQLAPSVGADVTRTWRNLNETNVSGKIDFELKLSNTDNKTNNIKFGLLGLKKERDFEINNYVFRAINQSGLNLDGKAENIFNQENIWTAESGVGVYAKGGFEPANTFNAQQQILAAYAMNELELTNRIKVIYGARIEKADNYYIGQNNDSRVVYDNENVLDELDVLPSANLVFAIDEKSNLRASYNKTVARPSFKEKSIAQIQDRISGRTFIGNIDLEQSDIDNFDLRYETFELGGQTFSVSGFYKYFKNPIELESFSASAPDNFQPKNIAESASLLGVELEATRKLGFIGDAFQNFTAGVNLTLVKSEVERSNAAELPGDQRMRNMVGQSPYIINTNFGYKRLENGLEVNASYNVQGKRLYIAGFGSSSDVYTQPFHSLNIKASKQLGVNGKYKFSISMENLLDDSKETLYEAFSGDTGEFENLNPGRTISFGFSANIR